jgi:hypothetical protein
MCLVYWLLSIVFAESIILNLNSYSSYTSTGTKNQGWSLRNFWTDVARAGKQIVIIWECGENLSWN